MWSRLIVLLSVIVTALAILGPVGPARAQTADPATQPGGSATPRALRSPVLVLDFDLLFTQSAYGRRVANEIEASGLALIEENDRIEAELSREEQALTDQRETLSPDAFRDLADAFDAKVQRLRTAQQIKAESVGQGREQEEARFRQLVNPIIGRVMQEAGAVVVLDRRESLIYVDAIDVTGPVLALADRIIGDGVNDAGGASGTADAPSPDIDQPETNDTPATSNP